MLAEFTGPTIPNGAHTEDIDHWSAGTVLAHFFVLTLPIGPNESVSCAITDHTGSIRFNNGVECHVKRIH